MTYIGQYSRYSLISTVTLLFLGVQDIWAGNSLSESQRNALLAAQQSSGIKVDVLKRVERNNTEWVILVGHADNMSPDDARLTGKVIKTTLAAQPECMVSGECTSLKNAFSWVKRFAGKNNSDLEIHDLEGAPVWIFPRRALKKINHTLETAVVGSASAALSFEALYPEQLSPPAVPQLAEFSKMTTSAAYCGSHYINSYRAEFYVKSCIDFNAEHFDLAMSQTNSKNQEALAQFAAQSQLLSHPLRPSWIAGGACFLSLSARTILTYFCPSAATTTASDVTQAILQSFAAHGKFEILSLVELEDFDQIQARLKHKGFTSEELTTQEAESTSEPEPTNP